MSENLTPLGPNPSLHRAILQAASPDAGREAPQRIPSTLECQPNQTTCAPCTAPGTAYDSPEGGVTENLRLEFTSSQEMIDFLRSHPRIRFVDVSFNDPLGAWHHCTFSTNFVTVENIDKGFGFDASSIPMFEKIDNSDFVMKVDVTTCFLDPFATFPTIQCVANVMTSTGDVYDKCPRGVLQKALAYMRSTGVADLASFGAEAEFFVFNDVEYYVKENCAGYTVNGDEAYWNGRTRDLQENIAGALANTLANSSSGGLPGRNLGHRHNKKEGYMTARPMDRLADLRSEMLLMLQQLGIVTEKHHHEVATCQMELNVKATEALRAADDLMLLKYVVRNVASRHNKSATFMPKPLHCDNGSGMHCNQSLWRLPASTDRGEQTKLNCREKSDAQQLSPLSKNMVNVFFDANGHFHQLSQLAMHYMAGILHHCAAILAISCPTTNSYKRLVPDFEAPVHITYSAGNRSTAIRIPTFTDAKSKRIEFRMPDASSSPYLAFACQVMAGVDGIRRKLEPPPMGTGNLFDETNPCLKTIERAPRKLEAALNALEADHDFLTVDNVFSPNFIKAFIKHKRGEVAQMNCQPHPKEFQLYYHI